MNIALFGTSADPPTIGHQQILERIAPQFDHVAVWASDNPFKQHSVSLAHRTEMLRCLLQEIADHCSNVQVHPELSDLRTIHTVERAQNTWPQARLTLVVGSDLVTQMHKWYRAEQLLQQVSLLIVPRPGSVITPDDLRPLQHLSPNVTVSSLVGLPVSSSAYRQNGSSHTVPDSVQAYICHHQLYQCQDSAPIKPAMQILR